MKAMIGLVIIFSGLLFIILTLKKFLKQKSFMKTASQAQGKFIGYSYSSFTRAQRENDSVSGSAGRISGSNANPKVEFFTKDGERIEFVNSASLSSDIDLQNLEVLYDPKNPKEAIVFDFFGVWGWMYITTGLGLILVLVGSVLRYFL